MGYSGINLENVKALNRSAILKLLNDQGEMSRKDISARLGLTPATVSMICSELLDAQILCEKGKIKEDRRAGRKRVLLAIHYERFFALAVSVGDASACVTLSDLRGQRRRERRICTSGVAGSEEFLCQIAEAGRELLRTAGVDGGRLLGVGVSIPGKVGREEEANVQDVLRRELNCPVIVENSGKAFATAELIYGGGQERENLLFVRWGLGVGACFVVHRQICESRRSNSAEIGPMVVEWEDPQRSPCRGPLESRVSTRAIADQVRAQCTQASMPLLYRDRGGDLASITAHNIGDWIACGDSGMWQVIEEDIDLLARTVSNFVTFLAPDQTIFYGDLFELPTMRARFLTACRRYSADCREETFSRSQLSDKLDYIGPLAIVVEERFLSGRVISDLGR